MRRITKLAAVLLLAASVLSLVSCKAPLKISEEEAYEALKTLIPASYDINVIFFGEGLPHGGGSRGDGKTSYVKVDSKEYLSVKDIKNAAEKVYSKSYLAGVYVAAFEGVTAGSSDGGLDTSVSPRYRDIGGELMINASSPVRKIRGRLELVSSAVGKRTHRYVVVSVVCRGDDGEVTFDAYLTKQSGTWLLDAPTY